MGFFPRENYLKLIRVFPNFFPCVYNHGLEGLDKKASLHYALHELSVQDATYYLNRFMGKPVLGVS